MARDATGSRPDPETEWIVIYDGNCGFCKWLLSGLLAWDRELRLRPLALGSAEADALLSDLDRARREASWHLIAPSGERSSGGAALPALLRLLPAGALPAAGFGAVPGITARGYEWVAAHRTQLSRGVPAPAKSHAARVVARREALLTRDRAHAAPRPPAG